MKHVSLIFAHGRDKQTNISERICFALWMNIYFDIILFRIPLINTSYLKSWRTIVQHGARETISFRRATYIQQTGIEPKASGPNISDARL